MNWPVAAGDGPPSLTLTEAAELAVTGQPMLDSLDARGRAAHESAIAARQLPDPKLNLGIADLPIDTRDAFSFTRDSDTQIQVGVSQDFPRAAKRRLRGELVEREASRLGAEHHLAERTIRRDAALAWVDLWRYERALGLTRNSLREVVTQLKVAEIALKTGGATQAEYLSARLEVNQLRDAVRGAKQSVAHAQNALSRWIGEAAFRPVSPDLTAMPPLPPLETVLDRVRSHPHLAGFEVQVAQAQTSAELAEAAYQADWGVALGYSHRPAFSEMVMLEVSVDLPFFTRNRQDRNFAAALAQKAAAESAVENANRQLLSEARLNHHDFARLGSRLRDYEINILPQGAARIEATLAGWRAGRDRLREVLEARRTALELRMAHLDLQTDLSKHFVQLSYLGAFDSESSMAEESHE
ncbi:MAG: TolC family protein [Candidatus Binataceae bacterium]